MAAIKFKSALGVERGYEDGFGGIDQTADGRRAGKLFSAENLDVRPDGALVSRCGYRQMRELDGEFRGHFTLGNKLYTVVGNSFEVTDTSSGARTVLGNLPSDSGVAEVFCFGGDMYVHDGENLYRHDGKELSAVEGYAPYYGMNWNPSYGGAVNEHINYLSDRILISYTVNQTTNSFYLGIEAASIDRVQIGLEIRNTDEFSLMHDSNGAAIIKSSSSISSGEVYFWLTLAPEASKKHKLARPIRSFVFGNNGGERLCFYSPGESGSLYCSKPVQLYMQEYSSRTAENELPLYFSKSTEICIGSGAYPITGMAEHYGRALLFTESNAWCVDYEGEEKNTEYSRPKVFMLNSAIGSEILSGAAYCENDPITYSSGALWRWHSRSGVLDECSATLVSDTVADLLSAEAESLSMISIPGRQSIYIADTEQGDGKMLVYNTRLKSWTAYKGIFAEKLLCYGNRPAFISGNALCVFTDGFGFDEEGDEIFAIKTAFTTHFLDFGTPERNKRSVDLVLSYDLKSCGMIHFETERGEVLSIEIEGGKKTLTERLRLPRFKQLRLRLEADAPALFESLILSAK